MDFFYFLVTGSDAWKDDHSGFHENFFITEGGFLWAFIGALVIGVIAAIAFYFGCCNSKKSVKYANIGMWTLFLFISGVLAYFGTDLILIGDGNSTNNTAITREYSFYKANDDFYVKMTNPNNPDAVKTETEIQTLRQKQLDIKDALQKGKDVNFEFNLTTALLAILVYFLTSMIVKRFTIAGKTIPMAKP